MTSRMSLRTRACRISKMLPIMGLQKTSLIDYPPYTACVVFIGGCNFRCPYCQNPDLVEMTAPDMTENEIFEFLTERKEWIDAVVITGGEPTLYTELLPFIETVKSMGFLVKLDTNGTNPKLLEQMLPMLDYVAMDIKAPAEDYEKAVKVKVDIDKVKRSIEIIKNAKDYEFRTTAVPGLFSVEEAHKIGKWLKGSKRFGLQTFRPQNTLDKKFMEIKPYHRKDMKVFLGILEKYVDEVELRGS